MAYFFYFGFQTLKFYQMKSRILLIVLLSIGVVFTACKKDDDDDEGDGSNTAVPGTSSMTLKVDGADWSASLAVVATNTNGVFSVTGSDANARQCGISVMNVNGPGTYDLGGALTNPNMGRWTASTNPSDTYTTSLGQGSGTIVITTLTDSRAEGTFEFTAKNSAQQTVSISSGTFSADISE
jgi:hypothetical protein